MERESLYAAICANPRDDLPKLVFADWLDERGDAVDRAHAELIRIQCEWETNAREYERALEPYRLEHHEELHLDAAKMAKGNPVAGRALSLLHRAAEVLPLAESHPVVELPHIHGTSFRHSGRIEGLRTELRISLKRTWEQRLPETARAIPIRGLRLKPAHGNGDGPWQADAIDGSILSGLESLTQKYRSSALPLAGVLSRTELTDLRRVTLHGNPFGERIFDALAAGEHLGALEEIELKQIEHSNSTGFTPDLHPEIVRNLRRIHVELDSAHRLDSALPLILLFANRVETRLEELFLQFSSDGDICSELLSRGEIAASSLEKLALCGGNLTGRGACDLLTTGALPRLEHLDLGGNLLRDLVGKRLERSLDYPPLLSLAVAHSELSPDGISALVHWPGFRGLRKLDLSGNAFNHAVLAVLATCVAVQLRTLGLARCGLHGSHVRELVRSPFVRSLWTLDLRYNEVDDAFIRALVETPFLDELQCLLLDLPDDDPRYDRLKARFGDRFQSA